MTAAAPLTLLESRAVEVRDPDALLNRVARDFPLNAFLESQRSGGFFHRSGILHVGQIAVSCSRHSPWRSVSTIPPSRPSPCPCPALAR